MYSQLAIIPRVNMINNIGLGDDSAHFSDYRTLSRDDQKLFRRNQLEMEFPLKHPKYVIQNKEYDNYVERIVYPSLIHKVIKHSDALATII